MSEEEKIKQFEEEQLDKLLVELKDIDNFKGFENGAFKYNLSKYQASLLLEYIEQLQQENEKLKDTILNYQLHTEVAPNSHENINGNELICNLFTENKNIKNILTEFEKWLKVQIINVNKSLELDLEEESKISLLASKSILENNLDKLQELKKDNNEI